MNRWLRRLRGALMMGVLWACGWALLSIPMELWIDPNGRIADIWPMVLAVPGFLAGTVFALVLAITQRKRRFEQLSIGRFAGWGAVAGVLLGGLVVALISGGMAAFFSSKGLVVEGTIALLSTLSAAGTLAIARKGEGVALPGGDEQRGRLSS